MQDAEISSSGESTGRLWFDEVDAVDSSDWWEPQPALPALPDWAEHFLTDSELPDSSDWWRPLSPLWLVDGELDGRPPSSTSSSWSMASRSPSPAVDGVLWPVDEGARTPSPAMDGVMWPAEWVAEDEEPRLPSPAMGGVLWPVEWMLDDEPRVPHEEPRVPHYRSPSPSAWSTETVPLPLYVSSDDEGDDM